MAGLAQENIGPGWGDAPLAITLDNKPCNTSEAAADALGKRGILLCTFPESAKQNTVPAAGRTFVDNT
jgi:hypothetical protein